MPKLIIRGKHKRGDRGSTEEEFKSSKRANMADVLSSSEDNPTLDDEDLETTDEPSLAELKEMLVDIQISIQSILRENKETRREVVQLKETVLEQKTTIASLKTTVASLEKQCANNENDLVAARKTIEEQRDEISELYELQDQLEQYTRKNSLEIHGVPESAYRSTEEVVLKLAAALEVPVQSQDIEISHKLPKKETYSELNDEIIWKNEWGGDDYRFFKSGPVPKQIPPHGETLHGFLTGARYNRARYLDSRALSKLGVYIPKPDLNSFLIRDEYDDTDARSIFSDSSEEEEEIVEEENGKKEKEEKAFLSRAVNTDPHYLSIGHWHSAEWKTDRKPCREPRVLSAPVKIKAIQTYYYDYAKT